MKMMLLLPLPFRSNLDVAAPVNPSGQHMRLDSWCFCVAAARCLGRPAPHSPLPTTARHGFGQLLCQIIRFINNTQRLPDALFGDKILQIINVLYWRSCELCGGGFACESPDGSRVDCGGVCVSNADHGTSMGCVMHKK